jgi:hypothetical protein
MPTQSCFKFTFWGMYEWLLRQQAMCWWYCEHCNAAAVTKRAGCFGDGMLFGMCADGMSRTLHTSHYAACLQNCLPLLTTCVVYA